MTIELSDDLRSLFDAPNYAHVATLLPDGSPHSVPMWTDIEDGRVVIMTAPDSRKARNMESDPRVAISIIDQENTFISGYVRGRLVEVVTGEAGRAIVNRLSNKYLGMDYPAELERVAFLIEPDHARYINLG